MFVSLNPNFAANQRLSFQKNKEKNSSYVTPVITGVVAGGVIGAGAASAAKKIAALEIPADKIFLNNMKNKTESLLGSKPVKKFALIGAAIGAIASILNTVKNNDDDDAIEMLKFRS